MAPPPQIAIVLGSGLGDFADTLGDAVATPYTDLPNWPASRVIGHAGRLVVGTVKGKRVAALAGRVHFYEGHDLATVAFAARVMARVGVKQLILTNAAGGINTQFAQGALMVIDDHINLLGSNPLVGPNDERFGHRFPDMSEVYSRRLRGIADEAARATGVAVSHGVYVAVHGPSYETPAEIRAFRTMGADAVGHVDGARSHCRASHGRGGARHLVHHEHGGRRAAAAAGSQRGHGNRATRPRLVHRVARGNH